jgi:hypothetical protein
MKRLAGLALVLATAGCGNGNDPLTITGTGGELISISLPGESAIIGTTNVQYALANSPDYYTVTFSTIATVTAPANGFVENLEADSSVGQAVTIYHNSHFKSRISLPNTATVRTGDYVTAGSQIGTINAGGVIRYSLIQDGALTCPYGYMTQASRQKIVILNPCP